ncbi:hypothetical protein TNCV_1457471 [Trichonephila clavipes]|nr:hypothetical protein TNCV_1457471 [Trichonephila clavipes]
MQSKGHIRLDAGHKGLSLQDACGLFVWKLFFQTQQQGQQQAEEPMLLPFKRALCFHSDDEVKEGQSQEIEVSRRSNCTNRLSYCLQAACTSLDTTLVRCVHSSIQQRAQTCFDMHGRHLKHLRL